MGASEREPVDPDEQPSEETEPEWPWLTVNANAQGELHVQWGWVQEGEWVELEGDARVAIDGADQQLAVAVQWWQQRWNEIQQAAMQRARAEAQAAAETAESDD